MPATKKDGTPRKTGYKHTKLAMKKKGQPGTVTLGSRFNAQEREHWHNVLEYCRENYAAHIRPERMREDCAMIILEAAMTQFGMVKFEVPAQETANDDDDRQLVLPDGFEADEEEQEEDLEDYDEEPSPPNPFDVDDNIGDVDELKEHQDFAQDDEQLPLHEE